MGRKNCEAFIKGQCLPITNYKALGRAEGSGFLLLISNMKPILDLMFHGSIFTQDPGIFVFLIKSSLEINNAK